MSFISASVWDANTDPRLSGSLFMSGFPLSMLVAMGTFAAMAKTWRPSVDLKTTSLKPYLLIQNGFMFGCHGAGLVVLFFLSRGGRDMFNLEPTVVAPPKPGGVWTTEFLISESIIRLSVIVIGLRAIVLLESVVVAALRRGRPSSSRIFNDLYLIALFYIGLRFLPGGASLFFALTYLMVYTYNYGYWVLKSAQMTDRSVEASARSIKVLIQFLWSAILFGHFAYIWSMPPDTKSLGLYLIGLGEGLFALTTFATAVSRVKRSRWQL